MLGFESSGGTAPEAAGVAEDVEGGGSLVAYGWGFAWTARTR